jgi:hypothetical protein
MTAPNLPECIFVMDPELALQDDPWVPGLLVQTFGGFMGQFKDYGAMLKFRTEHERHLNGVILPFQAAIRPPCFIMRRGELEEGRLLTIYGELWTPLKAYVRERNTGANIEEAKRLQHRVRDAMRRGWLYGKFYSVIEPNGETGCVHRSQILGTMAHYEWADALCRRWTDE